jgi:hypothetical protein
VDVAPGKFEKYLQGKLAHLRKEKQKILGTVLRQYKHLFYGLGSIKLGFTSQVEHSIDTGGCKAYKNKPLSDSLRLKASCRRAHRRGARKRDY